MFSLSASQSRIILFFFSVSPFYSTLASLLPHLLLSEVDLVLRRTEKKDDEMRCDARTSGIDMAIE